MSAGRRAQTLVAIGQRLKRELCRVAEEQSLVKLSDGSLYCVYRTIDGWPAGAYSRDGQPSIVR